MKSLNSSLIKAIVVGFGLATINSPAQTVIFNDDFSSGSTLNSATLAAPTANSTSYNTVSTESLTTTTIAANNMNLSFGTGSGNGYQIQALFSSAPVTLASVGDYLQLAVTFTDTGGFLTTVNGTLCDGMFNTGQIGPVAGGVNNENSVNNNAATGGAKGWVGYVGQVVTNHSYFNLRAPQTGSGNNNQDAVFGGNISATKGYNNPFSSIGTNSSGSYLVLNGQYTLVLTYELNGTGALAITNSLYAGAGTGGTQLTQFGEIASGSSYLTNSFDGLAFGFYANKTQNSAMDINQIMVSDSVQSVPEPSVVALAGVGLAILARRLRRG